MTTFRSAQSIAYISGPLTGVKHIQVLKSFYEDLGAACHRAGYVPYIPHLHTDPEKRPDIPPSRVYTVDKERVLSSGLIVAYVGIPSIGVGMELAYADVARIPIVLVYERNSVVSRFPRGIPTVIAEIKFDDHKTACKDLEHFLVQQSKVEKGVFDPIFTETVKKREMAYLLSDNISVNAR